MAIDLLGPASAPNAVTVRPADSRVFDAVDTWIQNCSSPSALDGTALQAEFFNGMLAQIRRAIRGMGVTEDNADDDMLLKAIQAAGSGYAKLADLLAYNSIYPYTGTGGGITASTGQIVLNSSAANWIIWRGCVATDATKLTSGQRTFATTANKTYHLRWHRTNGLALKDLADAAYNPSALAETSPGFDSTYDDALFARVVTNGSNVPTVTILANAPMLKSSAQAYYNTVYQPGWAALGGSAFVFNWARTPTLSTNLNVIASSVDRPDGTDIANTGLPGFLQMVALRTPSVTRYASSDLEYAYDDSQNTEGRLGYSMLAIA